MLALTIMYPVISLICFPFAFLLIQNAALGWEDENGYHNRI